MDWASIIAAIVSGIVAGVTTGIRSVSAFRSELNKANQTNQVLAAEVKDLRGKDLAKLEQRVDAVEKVHAECQIDTVAADLKNSIGWQKNTSLKLDQVQATVNRLEAHRSDDREWMQNISDKLDRRG